MSQEDRHVNYVATYVQLSLGISVDIWKETISDLQNKAILDDFFNNDAAEKLFIGKTHDNMILFLTDLKSPLSEKIVYFIKYKKGIITKDNFREMFMCGDLSSSPLKQFQSVVEEVWAPILSNPRNHELWPEAVAHDVTCHMQDFRTLVYKAVGQAQGRTLLPLPEGIQKLDGYDVESLSSGSLSDAKLRQIVYSIETAVIEWTQRVHEILEKSSEQPLLEGKHLGPLTEVEFWKERKENLEFIFRQLKDPQVRKMAKTLEKTKNCYLEAFRKLFRDVVSALVEAQDISIHLEKMKIHLRKISDSEFPSLSEVLQEVIHMISISCADSKYFSSVPSRIAVLVQKICNQLIDQGRSYLDASNLFQEQLEVSLEKVKTALEILNMFIEVYNNCRENISSCFQQARLYPWEFPDKRVFERFKKFVQRLEDIQDLFETAEHYFKLEKVKVIGVEKREHAIQIKVICKQFQENYGLFSATSYDVLDIENQDFMTQNEKFRQTVYNLDSQLGAIISQGCIECPSAEAAFELMQLFSIHLDRPIVKMEFTHCHSRITAKVYTELHIAKRMYDIQMAKVEASGKAVIYKNMPPVAGALQWSQDLKNGISVPVSTLTKLEEILPCSEDIQLIHKMHEDMENLLSNYEESVYSKWTENVEIYCVGGLQQPLFIRNLENQIRISFDSQLFSVAREVKYLTKLERTIPDVAASIYERSDDFRQFTTLLQKVAGWYNGLKTTVLPGELALIIDQLNHIDDLLVRGETEFTWQSEGLQEYVCGLYELTKDLQERVHKSKENIEEIEEAMLKWKNKPLYQRANGEQDTLLNIEGDGDVREHYADIQSSGQRLHAIVKDNRELLKATAETDAWNGYVAYLENIAKTSLFDAITCSLNYLLDNINPDDTKKPPFVEIQMELHEEIVFVPPLDRSKSGNLMNYFDFILDDIFSMAAHINKLIHSENNITKSREYLEQKMEMRRKFEEMEQIVETGEENMEENALMEEAKTEKYEVLLEEDETESEKLLEEDVAMDETDREILQHDVIIEEDDMQRELPDNEVEQKEQEEDFKDLEDSEELVDKKKLILERIKHACDSGMAYSDTFEKYSDLWLKDREEVIEDFLMYGPPHPTETESFEPSPPTEEQFKEQISGFELLYRDVEGIKTHHVIDQWLKIDMRFFKQALLDSIKKWSNLFKQKLIEQKSLGEL